MKKKYLKANEINIVKTLFQSKEIQQCIAQHFNEWARDDVRQDLFELILNLPTGTLEDKQNKGKLKPYIAVIIANMKRQRYGKIAKTIRQYNTSTPLPENIEHQQDVQLEDETQIIENFEKLDWYKKGILQLYAELKSVRAVSEFTGIPFESVKYSIVQTRKQLKQMHD